MEHTPSGSNESKPQSLERDLSGRLLGDYRLLRRLGEGAMAEVYLAEQGSLKRSVALKILKPRLAADETYVRRFQREAQAAASLVHANIVQIHDVGRIEQFHFIAQEYVEGQNLHQWMARHGSPDLPLALLIMRQTMAALTKAAAEGIVHRDIKPENIMLARNGEVKVADFGLARVCRDEEGLALTEIGITLGTPLYMSPEQIEGKPLDPRSDLYSAGVTFYQMLSGSPPFSGETALGVALQHVNKEPAPLQQHRPDLPGPLCRLVHQMLAKKPQNRPASPRDVLRELRQIQREHLPNEGDLDQAFPELADMAETPLPWSQWTQRLEGVMRTSSQAVLPRRRRALGWALGVAAAFVAGGLLALALGNEKPLLGEPDQASRNVPKQANAAAQWYHAAGLGTLRAWQSVVDYFPSDDYWGRSAKQQIARIYLLRDGDYDAALQIFNELASADDTDKELKAYGLAGKVVVYGLQNRSADLEKAVAGLHPLRGSLADRQMQEMLQHTFEADKDLAQVQREEWLAWLKNR